LEVSYNINGNNINVLNLQVNSTRVVGLDVDLADPLTMEWELEEINFFQGFAKEIEDEGKGFFLLPFMKRR
jgi:hypothetical protein